ncbi:hypothetical protein V495_06077 [Pseudogymnoascus sp. VKM F-4514 (FW-929)]|nr:hypothetical protein V495_06077 [Pseudogymnoascus sp. VKM F-4514 (FW-929)]KFY53964.1 hypothetical protein V497_08060 [Pseudogymnoascus sp. VKM F-4516 (FW-969)]
MESPCYHVDTGLYTVKYCGPASRSSFLPTYSSKSGSQLSPMYTLPILRLKGVVGQLVPDATLESVHEIPSTHITRLYTLNISGSRQLLLSLQPSLAVRLLRNEQALMLCEANLIHFLSKESTGTAIKSTPEDDGPDGSLLSSLIPKMLKHSSNTKEMGYPYTIFENVSGSSLSSQSIYLTVSERRHVDNQIGKLMRDLALITSPSGTFGPVLKVCRDPLAQGASSGAGAGGAETWSLAFDALAESILRDGEDMSVLLPYEIIRRQFARLSWRLKAVTKPRLTLPDAGDDAVVLVERSEEEGPLSPEDSVRVTGLRHWSRGVFGDPLMASCFENPSEGFSAGWKGEADEDLIEDQEGAPTRMMLYRCYRAIVDIVIEYYRPRNESSRFEMDARKRLTGVLTELETVDLDGNQTPKRMRTESMAAADMTMVKKLKIEGDKE